jgi:lycopene beta-cyclase
MDATIPQTDGLRFFYTLPLSPTRVLVEDTYFSDSQELDAAKIRAGVLEYAQTLGLEVLECTREEQGCLPLPLAFDFSPGIESPLRAGYAGGFFHPTTGYSFLLSLRLALCVARHFPDLSSSGALRDLCSRHARQLRFALLLNRLLFRATPPEHRRDVMERFHRLPSATIERFYALETSALDRARILLGRPPRGVSVRAALAEVLSA